MLSDAEFPTIQSSVRKPPAKGSGHVTQLPVAVGVTHEREGASVSSTSCSSKHMEAPWRVQDPKIEALMNSTDEQNIDYI